MRQLTALQALVEASAAKSAGARKVFQIFDPLQDKMDVAFDNLKEISEKLQSSVLTDLLKAEGFPATESKAAKVACEAAYQAVRKAANELADLHQALGMHFEQEV